MDTPNISDAEFKRCLIVWEKEPVSSSALATMCACSFGWARTTTHTFIRRLVGCGVLKNDKGTVTSLVSKETAQDAVLPGIIKSKFDNSEQKLLSVLVRLYLDISYQELLWLIKTSHYNVFMDNNPGSQSGCYPSRCPSC